MFGDLSLLGGSQLSMGSTPSYSTPSYSSNPVATPITTGSEGDDGSDIDWTKIGTSALAASASIVGSIFTAQRPLYATPPAGYVPAGSEAAGGTGLGISPIVLLAGLGLVAILVMKK